MSKSKERTRAKAGPVKPSVVHKKHELLNIIFVEYLVTLQSF